MRSWGVAKRGVKLVRATFLPFMEMVASFGMRHLPLLSDHLLSASLLLPKVSASHVLLRAYKHYSLHVYGAEGPPDALEERKIRSRYESHMRSIQLRRDQSSLFPTVIR